MWLGKNMRLRISTIEIVGYAFILLCMNPYLAAYSPIYIVLAFLAWNFFAFVENREIYSKVVLSKYTLAIILFLLYQLLLYGPSIISSHDIFLPCICIFGIYYLKLNNRDFNRHFIKLVSVYYILISVVSIYKFTILPGLARRLISANDFVIRTYGSPFTADFFFLLSIAIFNGFIATLFCKSRKEFLIVLMILNIGLLFKSDYSIAFLIGIIGIIIGYAIYCFYSKKSLSILIILSAFILILLLLQPILEYLLSLRLNNTISKRLTSIYELLFFPSSFKNSTSLGLRIAYYQESIITFLKHCVFGNGSSGIGAHSSLFDYLAKFGIIGNLLFYFGFVSAIEEIYCNIRDCSIFWFVSLTLFFTISIINPVYNRLPYFLIFFVEPIILKSLLISDHI